MSTQLRLLCKLCESREAMEGEQFCISCGARLDRAWRARRFDPIQLKARIAELEDRVARMENNLRGIVFDLDSEPPNVYSALAVARAALNMSDCG